ncbi:unnamed protein product, partial [Ectocarpus sp. 13 AM-2016]
GVRGELVTLRCSLPLWVHSRKGLLSGRRHSVAAPRREWSRLLPVPHRCPNRHLDSNIVCPAGHKDPPAVEPHLHTTRTVPGTFPVAVPRQPAPGGDKPAALRPGEC